MSEATPAGISKVHLTDAVGVSLGGGAGGPATIVDGGDVTEGTKADAAWDGIAGSATVVAILKKIATSGAAAGLTDTQLRASAVPVTFSGGVDVTDRAARLLGVVDKGKIWDGTNIVSVSVAGALKVDGSAVTQPVSGTFFQATQPVSLAAAVDVSDRAARLLGVVDKGKVWDGTNIAAVKAASTAAAATDPALVVAVSPNNSVAVTGTFFQGTQPVSGTVTTTPPANASTNVAQVAGTATSVNSGVKDAGTLRVTLATDQIALTNALKVDGSAVTQPVSLTSTTVTGSVAVTGPLTDTQMRASAVPVSLTSTTITGTVDVSDRAARLLGVVSDATQLAGGVAVTVASQPVTMLGLRNAAGNASVIQGLSDNADTLAVSAAGNTPRVAALTYMFNGTTYDRIRGTVAAGLTVTDTSTGVPGATAQPNVAQVGGYDGITLLAAKVQNRNGSNVLHAYDADMCRLVEQLLIEARIHTSLLMTLVQAAGFNQVDIEPGLSLVK